MASPSADSTTRWINLGSLEKVPVGQGLAFRLGSFEVAVFRQRDGLLFATQSRCPHKDGPLADGLVGGNSVICPLHAKKFDLATGKGPEAQLCVKTYPVKAVGGNILLGLDPGMECVPAA